MEPAAEELEVVRHGNEAAEGDERQEPEVMGNGDGDPDRTCRTERARRERDQHPGRDPRVQRAAVQLVERMRADPEPEEEGEDGEPEPPGRHVRRETGADDDIAQVPERVRQVQQGHVVAPAAGGERVEGRPLAFCSSCQPGPR